MKLLIPQKIKDSINDIETIHLEFFSKDKDIQNVSHLSINHATSLGFVELHDTIFDRCKTLQYKIVYKNKAIETVYFNNKFEAKKQSIGSTCVRCNGSKKSSNCNKKLLSQLDVKIQESKKISNVSIGTKNLIYYSVYFDKGYTDLLNLSIESILKHTTLNFDLLIITDESTKKLIEQLSFASKIQPKFHITETPIDGVHASKNKTKIFDYEHINEYNKILFLDCDVIAIDDISAIFNQDLKTNVLYTAYNNNLTYTHFKTIHHGFECLSDKFVSEMKKYKQMPFNAGQFLFRNTKRMKFHFENLNWMMEQWKGKYFFEQCFMCYYFCKAHITNSNYLQQYIGLTSTVDNSIINVSSKVILYHYISPPLNATVKLEFIKKLHKL